MYFPPKTQEGAKAETRCRRTTQNLIDWASGVISEAPNRTLPIIGLDLNDGLELPGPEAKILGTRERVVRPRKDGRADGAGSCTKSKSST